MQLAIPLGIERLKQPNRTRGIFLCVQNETKRGLRLEKCENRREHHNLYYIIEADRRAHEMPAETAETLRKKLFENFSKIIKPNANVNPPC